MPKPVRKMQKANAAAQAVVLPKIPSELLDQLVKGPMTAEAVEDASRAFKNALIERALGAEMSHHLGYAPGQAKPEGAAPNHRNGKSAKTVLTDVGGTVQDLHRESVDELSPFTSQVVARRFDELVTLDRAAASLSSDAVAHRLAGRLRRTAGAARRRGPSRTRTARCPDSSRCCCRSACVRARRRRGASARLVTA